MQVKTYDNYVNIRAFGYKQQKIYNDNFFRKYENRH